MGIFACAKKTITEYLGNNTPEWTYNDIPNLKGKVAIVTGGSSGIGYVSALELARKGAKVYLAGRSESKCNAKIDFIKEHVPEANVVFMNIDLLDFDSVIKAAKKFLEAEDELHLLINNAGCMFNPYELSKDGFELMIQTNYLSHYLLTMYLVPALKRAASHSPSGEVRIVNVSSLGHLFAPRDGIHFEDLNMKDAYFGVYARYGQSKLANILHSLALAKRLEGFGIHSFSVHPGAVHTDLYRHSSASMENLLYKVGFSISPERGALTQVYAATCPKLNQSEYNGMYLTAVIQRGRILRDHSTAIVEKLWSFTFDLFVKRGLLQPEQAL
ncbi:short chain dehydrogenase [Schizosaccharomyces japonicus yFS275]|uniref:Short chain dehydrogenase n=1 Tax=Schizosaccharomyces japonicus (strain yFS275 / FY16936) TaxID=402676 RepID=B6K0R4_SCHJY|nr:short chain dehydrogenase [Schizosaccharomyces japonicus yFS275]EEB07535.1 short chain dehydrogenase [Schizosaccharomyces japonicus yFS275]